MNSRRCSAAILTAALALVVLVPARNLVAQAAPPNITAINVTSTSITLTWTPVDFYGKTQIMVSNEPTVASAMAGGTFSGSTNSTTGNSYQPGKTYYFKGKTISTRFGDSAWSEIKSVTTLGAPTPTVPPPTATPVPTATPLPVPVVTVTSKDVNSATLSWTAVPGAAGYYIYDSLDPNLAGARKGIVGAGVLTYRVPGQSFGKTQYYRVQVFYTGPVNGGSSATVSTLIPSGITVSLAAPGNTGSIKVSTQNAKLSWGVVPYATSYRVNQCVDAACTVFAGFTTGSSNPRLPIATVTTNSYTTNSYGPGTLLYFRVQACNTSGCGGYSNPIQAGPF